jgi:hypothetical protein
LTISWFIFHLSFTKALLDWDDVDSMGDDVAVPALGQSKFFWSVVSSIILYISLTFAYF